MIPSLPTLPLLHFQGIQELLAPNGQQRTGSCRDRSQVIQIFTGGADNAQGLFFPSGLNTSRGMNGTNKDTGIRVPAFTINVSVPPPAWLSEPPGLEDSVSSRYPHAHDGTK